MSFENVEINSIKTTYDKYKTKEYRTDFNKPCDCQNCRNYYKHIEENQKLVEFLSEFGIDYNCTEEVFSWDLGNDEDSLIHHEGYYGVFGKIEGEEFEFEKFGVKITFQKGASVPCDRTGEFFWICIEGDFPYILDEERDLPITFSQTIQKLNVIGKIKAIFNKENPRFLTSSFLVSRPKKLSFFGTRVFYPLRKQWHIINTVFPCCISSVQMTVYHHAEGVCLYNIPAKNSFGALYRS